MRTVLLGIAVLFASHAPTSVFAAVATDPLPTFVYAVEAGDSGTGYFTQCTGMGSTSAVNEFRFGNNNGPTARKAPGRTTYTNVICRRGVTSALDIWTWRKLVEDGNISSARKNVSIILYDTALNEAARWNLLNAWPARVTFVGPSDPGNATSHPIEEIELVSEDTIRVK
jgi:phage tail-like protein